MSESRLGRPCKMPLWIVPDGLLGSLGGCDVRLVELSEEPLM
jgi:hypothetical protein